MQHTPLSKQDKLKQQLLEALHQPLKAEVAKQKEFLKSTEELYQSYFERLKRINSINGTSKYINETNWLKNELYEQLEKEFPQKDDIILDDLWKSFFSLFKEYSDTIPTEVQREQEKERFVGQASDTGLRSFAKSIKRGLFHINKSPLYFINLFKKKKTTIHYWSHSIPLKAMNSHFFCHLPIAKVLEQYKELQQLNCDARNIKWIINKDINSEVSALLDKEDISFLELIEHLQTMSEKQKIKITIENFDRKLKAWEKENTEYFDRLIQQFEVDEKLVGTIELGGSTYSTNRIETAERENKEEFRKIYNGWRNTQYAQIDDFQIDLELYQVKYQGLKQFYLLQGSCKSRIDKTIENNIHQITTEVNQVKDLIKDTKNLTELKDILVSERIRLNHQLKLKTIPSAINTLYNQNFPHLIERMEHKIRGQLNHMKPQRIIYSKETYDAPIPKSNLSHFNPKELVEIDLMRRFSIETQAIKAQLLQTLQNVETFLNDLIEIVDYNLDAAINLTNNQTTNTEVQQIALEGLERVSAKNESIEKELNSISHLMQFKLKKKLDFLNSELITLTENENITDLRIKLAKAKAVEKTKAYRKEIVEKARNFIPIAIRFVRKKLHDGVVLFNAFQERIGLIEKEAELTTELSDFLSQTEQAIQKLPFIYRRLYEIKPLEEEAFFEGRSAELNLLKKAYSEWNNEMRSSAVIIGEKGSGSSSLINFFRREHPGEEMIIHQLKENISTEQEFIRFFNQLLTSEELDSFSSIVNHLNTSSKKVIILEDIHLFFLKQIHGFEAINLLFELISQTAQTTFWVVTTSPFTWSYLHKAISIERYIKHKIILSPLSNEQIINLIMKRHRVSGYNLQFQREKQNKHEGLKFIRSSEGDQQSNFKKNFFSELNQFAQSNISLALLYWLHSTSSFADNTVVIGKIKNIRFDFLSSLDKDSIFTLHAILLHESLSLTEHTRLFHQSEKQSRMTLMVLEDGGILTANDGRYSINQILYRQVINVLKNKNLIH